MTQPKTKFRDEITFEKRQELSTLMLKTYPDRVPIIVESFRSTDPQMSNKKFLSPSNSPMSKILSKIREGLPDLDPTVTLCLYVTSETSNDKDEDFIKQGAKIVKRSLNTSNDAIMVPLSSIVGMIYDKYKADDGFLYLTYTIENYMG